MLIRIVLYIIGLTGSLLMLICINWIFRNYRQAKELMVNRQRYDGKVYSSTGNFFGQKSKGFMQIRGCGSLSIDYNSLEFKMWLLPKKIEIKLANIVEVERIDSFLGKRKSFSRGSLVKVKYYNKDRLDSCAWKVKYPEKLKLALEQAIENLGEKDENMVLIEEEGEIYTWNIEELERRIESLGD